MPLDYFLSILLFRLERNFIPPLHPIFAYFLPSRIPFVPFPPPEVSIIRNSKQSTVECSKHSLKLDVPKKVLIFPPPPPFFSRAQK